MAQKATGKPKRLSGGNPQIPKGFGEAPVKAYITAMPGWKKPIGETLDRIISQTVPDVKKAVKWNTPLYGVEEGHWFTAFHCFDRYVKISFFQGASMDPVPPEASKVEAVRYFHVHEDDELDEDLLARWMTQASRLPGEKM